MIGDHAPQGAPQLHGLPARLHRQRADADHVLAAARHDAHPAAGLGEEGGGVAGVEHPDAADLLSLLAASRAERILVGVHLVDVRGLECGPLA